MKYYRKIKKQLTAENLLDFMKEHPFQSLAIFVGCLVFFYIVFNSSGVYQRVKLEHQKSEMQEKIRVAEAEQQRLKDQSKALDGDHKAIEKVAREKYGMVREGEKVYKATPKK
jgi:cell division protein FtsB